MISKTLSVVAARSIRRFQRPMVAQFAPLGAVPRTAVPRGTPLSFQSKALSTATADQAKPSSDKGDKSGSSNNSGDKSGSGNDSGDKGKKERDDSIPFGVYVGFGVIAAIIFWFYRGHRSKVDEIAFKETIRARNSLAQEEVEELREKNELTAVHLVKLADRARQHFGQGPVDPKAFVQFALEQLGGQFVLRGAFKSGYLLERLLLTLPKDQDGKVDLDVLIMALSLNVSSPPEDIVDSYFTIFADAKVDDADAQETEVQEPAAEGEEVQLPVGPLRMTTEKYIKVVDGLLQTCQLPARSYIKEIKEYPYNRYEAVTPEELSVQSIESLKANRKKSKKLQGHEEAEDVNSILWNKHDFEDLLFTYRVCVWGECHGRRRN